MRYLADRITDDLVEKTRQAHKRLERRFNLEWVDEISQEWLAAAPRNVQPCNIGVAFTNPAGAMQEVDRLYREANLADADVQFEVWVEKDASDDNAPPIADLYACRGFASLTFIHHMGGDDLFRRCLSGMRGRRRHRRDAGQIGG